MHSGLEPSQIGSQHILYRYPRIIDMKLSVIFCDLIERHPLCELLINRISGEHLKYRYKLCISMESTRSVGGIIVIITSSSLFVFRVYLNCQVQFFAEAYKLIGQLSQNQY
jgi:hypothetical protein